MTFAAGATTTTPPVGFAPERARIFGSGISFQVMAGAMHFGPANLFDTPLFETDPNDIFQIAGGNVRIGEISKKVAGVADYGRRLYFSGGPVFTVGAGSENSDPLWIARFNNGIDNTQLRVNVSDDITVPGSQDFLNVGETNNSNPPVWQSFFLSRWSGYLSRPA